MAARDAAMLALLVCCALPRAAAAEGTAPTSSPASPGRLPPLMVWAWERPCDLAALDPRSAGVAALALTLRLDADGIAAVPRRQPLLLPPAAPLVAVARLETDSRRPPRLDSALAQRAAAAIAGLARRPGLAGLQVDFDAAASERGWYGDLLRELRRRVPEALPISITALASWCLGDRWLAGLPVAEAVPMLFRMGPDAEGVRRRLGAGEDFDEPLCRSSVGLSSDEPAPRLPPGRRRYLFLAGGCGPGGLLEARRREEVAE